MNQACRRLAQTGQLRRTPGPGGLITNRLARAAEAILAPPPAGAPAGEPSSAELPPGAVSLIDTPSQALAPVAEAIVEPAVEPEPVVEPEAVVEPEPEPLIEAGREAATVPDGAVATTAVIEVMPVSVVEPAPVVEVTTEVADAAGPEPSTKATAGDEDPVAALGQALAALDEAMAMLGTTMAPVTAVPSVAPVGDAAVPVQPAGGTVAEHSGTEAAPAAVGVGAQHAGQPASPPSQAVPSVTDSEVGSAGGGEAAEDEADGRTVPPAQETPVERGSTPPVRRSWWRRMFVRNAG